MYFNFISTKEEQSKRVRNAFLPRRSATQRFKETPQLTVCFPGRSAACPQQPGFVRDDFGRWFENLAVTSTARGLEMGDSTRAFRRRLRRQCLLAAIRHCGRRRFSGGGGSGAVEARPGLTGAQERSIQYAATPTHLSRGSLRMLTLAVASTPSCLNRVAMLSS
ncbi:hypothetical protein L596_006093 [Steinernema carpocapsae]|uniref:Uncharacterized protein n=1 Tax=Steinernema carpocapsae TaxID=34508 RepID=A0A4U8V2I0_STECR|nr:hypothetical protein L596_006093 [Steinernema carpocapsae]